MGRPLKIKKATEAGGATGIDIGFTSIGELTNPVNPVTLTTANFTGVVGGSNTVDSAAYPTVKVRVFITGLSEEDGYIIRQKGAHKYLVGGTTNRTALVQGVAYRITTVGNTNWASYGVVGTAAVGTVFTATAALASTGTGRVNGVGVCVLSDDLSPTAGLMSISYFSGGADSTESPLSKLTNKFMLNFAGGNPGGTADGGWVQTAVINDVRYATNFFTDEGTEVKSGTTGSNNVSGQQNLLDMAIIENYNS